MVREFARTRVSSYDDPTLEELTADAQFLYFRVFLPHPALSAAGVVTWKPRHWVRKARGMTLTRIMFALAELERARMILVDLDTEELLVRSYIRNDEPLRNPKMAGAVIKAYQTVASRPLQAALVTEIARIHDDHPEYSSWDHKDTKAGLALVLGRPALASVGYADALAEHFADVDQIENANGQPVQNGNPNPVENTYQDSVENGNSVLGAERVSDFGREPTSNSNLNTQPATSGGHLTGVRHLATAPDSNGPPPKFHPEHPDAYEPGCAECERFARRYERHLALALSDTEPSPHCDRHPGGTTDACRDCGRKREENRQWHTDRRHAEALRQSEAAHQSADIRARAIADCALCDATGYRGSTVCDHDPGTPDRARRGMATIRAALAQRPTEGHADV